MVFEWEVEYYYFTDIPHTKRRVVYTTSHVGNIKARQNRSVAIAINGIVCLNNEAEVEIRLILRCT